MLKIGSILLLLVVCVVPRIRFITSLKNIFLLIRNKLPYRKYLTLCKLKKRVSHKLGGRLLQLLNALPDHPLKKNEILDIVYNGLTDASRDFLDSCAGCGFRERTVGQAEELLNNILKNDNERTLPEPPPKPSLKKRGILFLSPEDMQEAKKSMKEKVLKLKMLRIYHLLKKYMVLITRHR